jgi:hypothetical protein
MSLLVPVFTADQIRVAMGFSRPKVKLHERMSDTRNALLVKTHELFSGCRL